MNRISLLIIGLMASVASWAATVVAVPGNLSQSIAGDVAAVESLTVTGSVDARDLFFIARSMPALTSLDLSGCTIEAYRGEPLEGKSAYDAATIPTGCFAGTALSSIALPSPVVLGDMAFAGTKLTSVDLSQGSVALGMGCFASCGELASAKLGAGVAGGSYTFRDCTALAAADLAGLTAVGDSDFAGCRALSAVTSTGTLTTIGARAFFGCYGLKGFAFPATLTAIGDGAFMESGLERAELGSATGLKTIGAWAFAGDADLTAVHLPESATEIGPSAFFDCYSLSSLDLPSGCRQLPDYLLKDAAAMAGDVALPTSVTSIGNYSLKGASGITGLYIPGEVTSIGDGAMEGMTALNTIDATALRSVPALDNNVWAEVDQPTVRLDVHPDIADSFRDAPQWQDFRINATDTGIDNSPMASAAAVSGIYTGATLSLRSTGADIAVVDIYNLDGRLLAQAAPASSTCTIDTSALDAHIIVVRCFLADGTVAALKMAY